MQDLLTTPSADRPAVLDPTNKLDHNKIDAQVVPLEEVLYDEEFNCRGNIQARDVVDLARDIEAHGLMQPVTVAPYVPKAGESSQYKYKLIAGFRRYMAHKLIKLPNIKVIVQKELADETRAICFNLTENIQRAALDIMQEAKSVQKLLDLGKSRAQIGLDLGMGDGWVQIRQMLLKLPEEIQELASAKVISQPNIRELFTVMKHAGRDVCIQQARKINDAKARGQKEIVAKVKNTKRMRGKKEIFQQMEYMQTFLANGLWSRCFAWAAGEIDDDELETSIKQHCDDNGIEMKERPNEMGT